ncbi:hypothetical protein CCAND95_10061 [Capnocytophaga canis]|uniref:Uncharacterized protein n=1 Tax=Capnocytophaga canis TaxID=1848903 RepID=A0A0B7HUW1_9FLAO|nr:hypothetical protein CCAND95_10061 [Capnocytophaga canis]CEN43135.1 hypothetical protein CCAND38_10059 [Capnocytophaga canis]
MDTYQENFYEKDYFQVFTLSNDVFFNGRENNFEYNMLKFKIIYSVTLMFLIEKFGFS